MQLKILPNVTNAIQGKNVLCQSEEGEPTSFLKTATEKICTGIESSWNTWQQSVIVNNIQVNGGSCTPTGPLGAPAIGIGPPGCITQQFQSSANEILGNFPADGFEEVTPELKAFITGIAEGLLQTLNQWVTMISLQNIQVNGGLCTCQIIPPPGPGPIPGSYSNGIGQLAMLQGNLQPELQQQQIVTSIKNAFTDELKQSESGDLTEGVIAFVEGFVEGFMQSIQQWMQGTQVTALQVNGGTTFPGAPLAAAMGMNGRLV
jgi:hypothetical protein